MKKQLRVSITVSPEEDEAIAKAYARYLLDTGSQLSKTKWIKQKIMEMVRE